MIEEVSSLTDPAMGAFEITPADEDLAEMAYGVYIGGLGDLAMTMADDSQVVFVGVSAGSILPIVVKRVASATTATSIVGLR